MLRELVRAYERFRDEGLLLPSAYKLKDARWVIDLGGQDPFLGGPYKRGDIRRLPAPDRQHSGKPGPGNLKPFLLFDKAQYSLGKSPPAKEVETAAVHRAFLELLDVAQTATGDEDIGTIRRFATSPPANILDAVEPSDLVAFRVDPLVFPFERASLQEFWRDYLATELESQSVAVCGVCGETRPILRLAPRELVVMGQKCQAISVNTKAHRAFGSLGREQLNNSPICAHCANAVVDTLDYLVGSPTHGTMVVRHRNATGRGDPLHNQLAIYWLSTPIVATGVNLQPIDLEAALRALLTDRPTSGAPKPDLVQLEALIKTPWTGRSASLNLATESFSMAVLSANKGRLVVRDWYVVSVNELRERLSRFLDCVKLVSFGGEEPRARSIASILDALPSNPNLATGLLRTAYIGHQPPANLIGAAVPLLRTLWQKGQQDGLAEIERIRKIEALTTAIKLALAYREEDNMQQLNSGRKSAPYLCGRLLAVLEEAQLRAHKWRINRTIVNRSYGSASTTPRLAFGPLLRLATTAHLADAGRDVNELVQQLMTDLDEVGGFPPPLMPEGSAEFGLGFFHQRADFSAKRRATQ